VPLSVRRQQSKPHPRASTKVETSEATALVRRLRNDERLHQIALLSGRFKRILASKRRERTRSGADEIANIEQGADLARLVPNELARFSHPLQRLAFLRDFTERAASSTRSSRRDAWEGTPRGVPEQKRLHGVQ
jgi:uncharacterized protein with von Willebrand factor type A (vWA) domain